MTKDVKVFLTEPIDPVAYERLASATQVTVGTGDMPRSEVLSIIKDYDVLFNKFPTLIIDAEVIDAMPRLRLIARHGTGFNNVDVEYATKKGIPVTATIGVNAVSMAEYTLGLMFVAARKIVQANRACYSGNIDRLALRGMELQGKTFGIIGVGHIGREVVKRVHALGMKVIAYHPRPSAKKLADLPLELVSLEELLAQSDVISIHTPFSQETEKLLNAQKLSLLKPTACIVNVARGGIVDEQDMLVALREERLACYITDVLDEEPVQANNPLLAEPRAIVLPHYGATTYEAQFAVGNTAVDDILRVAEGKRPRNVINPAIYDE